MVCGGGVVVCGGVYEYGRYSRRLNQCVPVSVCLFVCLFSLVNFYEGPILALG